MLFFDDFGAWITVDGEALEEFKIESDIAQRRVSCYIASVEGKSFQIHWCDREFKSATRGRVSIDGRSMGGKIIHSSETSSVTKKGFRTGSDKRVPFIFSKLNLTDEDEGISYLSPEKPGEINIVIIRVRTKGVKDYQRDHTPPLTRIYNEKKLKGSAHNTTFGNPIADSRRILYHETEPYGDPVAHFCFRYMPTDLLRANDIAPYPPRERRFPTGEEEEEREMKPDVSTISGSELRRSVSTLERSSSTTLYSNSSRATSTLTLVGDPVPVPMRAVRANEGRFSWSIPSSPFIPIPTRAVRRERIDWSNPSPPSRRRTASRIPPNAHAAIDLTHL
ncbi:hypothetical protein GYMLUDRAFT_42423 [Collybiopsis luxurians FD-317 M1]|uniref:DUF7918 domain-containing protein n=1 Tax=Collybiopsis luxurians FD-317 M1 TaxID=944289 RepID=A0A0D0CH92_9AGAR|nr:hypothetical protein GYMLUDRAFT_42423 [Collybiopsis luxurians FD-317 M1]